MKANYHKWIANGWDTKLEKLDGKMNANYHKWIANGWDTKLAKDYG